MNRPVGFLLLLDPRHEEDVVVLAHGDQNREQEDGHFPIEAGESRRIEQPKDGKRHPQRGEIAQHNGRHEINRNERARRPGFIKFVFGE